MEKGKSKTANKPATTKVTKKTKEISPEKIRFRAYEIYVERGGEGNSLDHWTQAEKELYGSLID